MFAFNFGFLEISIWFSFMIVAYVCLCCYLAVEFFFMFKMERKRIFRIGKEGWFSKMGDMSTICGLCHSSYLFISMLIHLFRLLNGLRLFGSMHVKLAIPNALPFFVFCVSPSNYYMSAMIITSFCWNRDSHVARLHCPLASSSISVLGQWMWNWVLYTRV